MPEDPRKILRELYPTPRWFPRGFNSTREWVKMVRFTNADYRAASFLDERGERASMPFAFVPYAQVAKGTPANARRDAHWIFHIGHVGSTFISRLAGEIERTLVLREPVVLRFLAVMDEAERADRLPVLRALLSRTFAPDHRAIVKATSHVSDHAAELVGDAAEGSWAIMIRMQPERYVASRLGGNLKELHARAPKLLARLAGRFPTIELAEAGIDDARLAAVAWAVETSAMEAAAQGIDAERMRFVDFDRFLTDPLSGLREIATHFGLPASEQSLAAIVQGPLASSNAKDATRRFETADRESRIFQQQAEHAGAIKAATKWLDDLAAKQPLVAAALARS